MSQHTTRPIPAAILIVGDHYPGLTTLASQLQAAGYPTYCVPTTAKARQSLAAEPPAVVLLAAQLAGSFTFCKKLKAGPATAYIQALFFGPDDSTARLNSFKAGAEDYFTPETPFAEIAARLTSRLAGFRRYQSLLAANAGLHDNDVRLRALFDNIPIPTYTWKNEGAGFTLLDYNRAADEMTAGKIAAWIGVSAAEFYHDRPDILQDLHTCLQQQNAIQSQYEYVFRSTGESRFLAVKYAFVPPDLVMVHTEDVDARVRMEAQLIKRINELHALHRIAQILTTTPDLPWALEMLVKTVCEIFAARSVFILLHDETNPEADSLIGFDQAAGLLTRAGEQTQSILPALINQINTPARSRVVTNLPDLPLPAPARQLIESMNLHTALTVGLFSRSAPVGLLVLARESGETAFTAFDIRLAETVAVDIAAAIENDRLRQRARQAAVAAERQRLARELHDSVTQSIYSLTLLGSAWATMSRQGTLADAAESFERLGEIAQQALKEMRLMIYQQPPSIVQENGLLRALEQRLQNVEQRAQLQVDFTRHGDLHLIPVNVQVELFNIAQEALNNSLRHAQAQHLTIELSESQGVVRLIITDDGKGFIPAGVASGMGHKNMQARAQSIAADFALDSAPGAGTRVEVAWGKKEAETPT